MHKILITWLVGVLVSWVPPGRKLEQFPEARETQEEALARYHSIASDALDVAFLEEERPLFGGAEWTGRARTALLILSVALKESGFRKDVDLGKGKMAKGDNGRSVCLMQLNLGTGTVPVKDAEVGSWDAAAVLGDRKKCFRAALHLMRRSFHSCGGPLQGRLAAYASGSCDKGQQASFNRIRAYQRAWERHPISLPK